MRRMVKPKICYQRVSYQRHEGYDVTDSTIAPPPKNPAISLTNVSRLLNTKKDAMKIIFSIHIILFAKDYRPMTSGWQEAPPCFIKVHIQELVSKPAISLNKS